jgi:hypothetical protein
MKSLFFVGLFFVVSCSSDKILNQKIEEQNSKISVLDKKLNDLDGKLATIDSATSKLSERQLEDETHIVNVGYFEPGWSYKNISGATNLTIVARNKNDKCNISGNFAYNSQLPTQVSASIISSKEIVLTKIVPIDSDGTFVINGVSIDCEKISKVEIKNQN